MNTIDRIREQTEHAHDDAEGYFKASEIRELLAEIDRLKPRTVTTAAELDALPVGSVVLDNEGDVWQHRGYAAYQWCNTTGGRNSGLDTSEFAADCLPATVLHEGEK